MPVIKSAKKKLRQDKKRQAQNKLVKTALKAFIKSAKIEKTQEAVKKAFQAADKAAKKRVIHSNKAARIKSTLSKLLPKVEGKKVAETTKTKATKKASSKK